MAIRRVALQLPRIATAVCVLAVAGCVSTPSQRAVATASYVVVRHAEKGSDDGRDPGLSRAGAARAKALAARLANRDVVAVYATAFRRTHDTALPTATAHALSVQTYDAAQPPGEFAAALRRNHPRGTVLVVGHSNTVPGIVSVLCACAVAPIDDATYDRWLEVRIEPDGTASLTETRD